MVLHFDGGYRTATECKFLEQVENELAKFQNTCKHNSVLVFPPLGARYRYLIHQLVGLGSRLQTVSIGQGQQRRTVVYVATGREISEMEQSPPDTQRTFFGRGRGRRTRRPDQKLYVPGALRQAKCGQQDQNLSTESLINRGKTMNLSTNSTSTAAGGVESTISRFTTNDGTDCNKINNKSGQNCDAHTDKSLQGSTPVSKGIVDVTEGTGSVSSDAHEQHANVKSQCTSVQRLLNENKEMNMEHMPEKDGGQTALKELKNELVITKAKFSTMTFAEEAPNASHIRDERQERDISIVETESNAMNKQILETESSNNEIKYTVDDHRIQNLQVCTCVVSNDRAAKKALIAVHENCGASHDKHLNEDKSVTEQNHEIKCPKKCKTNPIKELNHKQDGPSLEEYKDLMVDEKKLDDGKESKLIEDIEVHVKAGHLPETSFLDNSDFDGGEMVGYGESCTERKLVQVHCVNSEGSETLAMLGSNASDHKGENTDNKAITHGNSMQIAFSHEMTLECRDPTSGLEGLLSPAGKLLAQFDDLKTCGDHSSNQNRAADPHNQSLKENVIVRCKENTTVSDLIVDQSNTSQVEAVKETKLKTPRVMSMSADKNIASSNYVNDQEVTSDILDSTCSINVGKLESQINNFGVLVESKLPLEIMTEENQATSDRTEGGSDSTFLEGNQSDDGLQAELAKTSKKKKSKKDKSKDQKDDKTKSKEKGEKKKKKEKKSVKAEKSDKEQVLDSGGKIKEGRKSKTKALSTKEQNEEDLNTGVKGSDSRNDDGDDGDDSDNWESNFDESGDCLNPEHSEELSRLTGIENPKVHKTQFDYYSFTPKEVELDDEEFGHIVEIYNFSSELKTQDLMQALSSFRSKGFDIKWVDDTHALGIFSSSITAQEAIKLCSSPLMKLRPVSQGTPESRRKATNCFDFLQPYKERPKTSKLLADRLVTGALGMRSKMTREERVKEREKLKEAKDKKEQEKIQKAQIWGD